MIEESAAPSLPPPRRTRPAGLLKGLSAEDSAALRQRFLADSQRLFSSKRRRTRAAGGGGTAAAAGGTAAAAAPETPLPERHAVVLGLKAFVLSTPYDVPPWLPEVLMALVRLAAEPPPIRCVWGGSAAAGAS